MSDEKSHTYQPVLPVDADHSVDDKETKIPQVTVRPRRSSTSSSGLTLRTPKAARFTEATSVNSPIDPTATGRNPFADPHPRTTYLMPQPQPSDVGFGYVADNQASKHSSFAGVEVPLTPASPLKSALKPPGTPGRFINPLSPTFKEEQILEKQEESTEKQNAKDLKVKTRVRMAKMALRGVNFSCSLIVLAMLSTSLTIFNATKAIPPRSNLPPWAQGTKTWPQILLLCIACVSLVFTICILVAYRRGGHKRAQKAAAYYTMFAVGFFLFSTIMWIIGAAVLHQAKAGGNGKDMWGWSCKGGKRQTLFQEEVDYNLICRLQSWSLVCAIIEIVVEVITITIYGIVFYRFHSKRKLHKSMDLRDRARSDLYLAQLRSQSAPNTPGFQKTPMSPSFPAHLQDNDPHSAAENGEYHEHTQFAQKHQSFAQPKPFTLQPPPIRVQHATPAMSQDGFEPAPAPAPKVQEHVPAAPGEQVYESVPIPGAYASPIASPAFHQPQSMNLGTAQPGQAYTAESRIESPPSSPRLPRTGLR